MNKDLGPGERPPSVFLGTWLAFVQRIIGAILCTVAPAFLIVGIVLEGVRWKLHPALAIFLLFVCLYLLFLLEGTQIAVVRLKEGGNVAAHCYTEAPDIAELLEKMGNDGVATYLIGRQVLVCANVYIVAALTELGDPLVSPAFTIVAGILTVVCYGQLIPQLMADIEPITFFGVPGVRFIIVLSSQIAKCGVGHFSYWLGTVMLKCLPKQKAKVADFDFKKKKDADEEEEESEDVEEADLYRKALTIFDSLEMDPALDVKHEDHMPLDVLMAVFLGMCKSKTSEESKAIFKQLLQLNPRNHIVQQINLFTIGRDERRKSWVY